MTFKVGDWVIRKPEYINQGGWLSYCKNNGFEPHAPTQVTLSLRGGRGICVHNQQSVQRLSMYFLPAEFLNKQLEDFL